MPSVFTIEGASLPRSRKRKTRKKKRRSRPLKDAGNGCKWVKNTKTGCEIKLCPVSKSQSPTGWKFMKGSSRCPGKRRR